MASSKHKPESAYEGHGDSSTPPSIRKGKFESPATFLDSGSLASTYPKGTSPNVKSGQPSGESIN
jgi:hypothetical protein